MRAMIATAWLALAASATSCGSTADEHGTPTPLPIPDLSGTEFGEHPIDPKSTNTTSAPGNTMHTDWRSDPLPPAVLEGLRFLLAAQAPSGGYGQDGVKPREGVGLESDGTDVANTAMVSLAMLRAGTTPTDGAYTDNLLRAVDYILNSIEKAPDEGLSITDRNGTQIQRKLGPFVDTFLSSMLLAECIGQMPDAKSEARVQAALEKVVAKIEDNQQADGSWNSGGGWAPVISTSLASRGLWAAKENGVQVDGKVLDKVDSYTKNQFDGEKKSFKVGAGDAGVALYKVAQAYEQASRSEKSRQDNSELLNSADRLLSTENFQAGFGSMGGEEFISYMNISDSLIRQGGEKWEKWNGGIKGKLVKLQNGDGSWAGHHCITGRIACTSAAIMTILTERTAPQTIAKKD